LVALLKEWQALTEIREVEVLHLTGHLAAVAAVPVIGQWDQKVDHTLPFTEELQEQEHILQNM
jgi:hypothetical protein